MSINSTRPGGTVGGLTPTGQEVVTNKDIDGTTASNTSRITMPKASTGVLAALTRKQGTVVYDTTANSLMVDDGTNLNTIGGGAGELNMVAIGSSVATGWTAATGATVGTTSTAGDLPLASMVSTALQITSGTGISTEATLAQTNRYSFTTPASYAVKTKVELWMRPGTNFANNEWTVSIYAGSTRQALTTDSSSFTYLPNANGKFTTYFDAVASTAYTVRFTRKLNALTNAAVHNVANVIVGPGIQPQGAVVGEWQSYTPTLKGSLGDPTLGTGGQALGWYRRVGSSIELEVAFKTGTSPNAGTGAYYTTLPTGLTIDFSRMIDGADGGNLQNFVSQGSGIYNNSGVGSVGIAPFTNGITNGIFFKEVTSGTDLSATYPSIWWNNSGIGDTIQIRASVPIVEWAGSGTVNLAQNDKQFLSNSSTSTTTSDTTSFSYGPTGNSVVAVSSTGVWVKKRVQLQAGSWTATGGTPIVKVSPDGLLWLNAVDVFPANQISGLFYGIDIQAAGASTVDIAFGGDGANSTQAWSVFTAYKWRVDVAQSNEAIGFGSATATSSGLVPNYQAGTATVAVSGTKFTFPSLSIAYAKVGDVVTVSFEPKGAGWSTTKDGAGAFTVSQIIPVALRPNVVFNFPYLMNRNGTITNACFRLQPNGTLDFFMDFSFNDFVDGDVWTPQNRNSFSYNVTAP